MVLRFSQASRKFNDDAIVGVLCKCLVWEVREGEETLKNGKREEAVKQEGRAVKAVYSCGVRLVKALETVKLEAMM